MLLRSPAETQGDLLLVLEWVAVLPLALVAQDQTSQGISGKLLQLGINQSHI